MSLYASSGSTTFVETDAMKAARKAASDLQLRLFKAQVEQRPGTLVNYVPEDRQLDIITPSVIKTQILPPRETTGLAQKVYNEARKLFTILAYMGRAYEICAFIDEGLSDSDLPLTYHMPGVILKGRHGNSIPYLSDWRIGKRLDFAKYQWSILVPVFSGQQHYVFHENTILPFVHEKLVSGGAYSDVCEARIHHAHHITNGVSRRSELPVAIKKLRYHDKAEFDRERSILIELEAKNNSHLVKLLFSYEYKGIYHLVFMRATGNLRDYWEQHPSPHFDLNTVLWSLSQMRGIARGLHVVHNFTFEAPQSTQQTEMTTPQGKAVMSVRPDEVKFGRHGDLKPENILYFSNNAGGTCQITDFGLGRFHGRETRTKAAPYTIFSSPTYEPPECHIFLPVSRAYDLWSLGCIYLEWVSWMLKGWEAIDAFSQNRVEESYILNGEGKIRDDYFWSLLIQGNKRDARVRDGVERWVRILREDPHCSLLIHDLLNLIMNKLLCVIPKHRADASTLSENLNNLLTDARKDHGYALTPSPWVPKA
ncbi:Cyclin-dependent kinase 4 [Diplodia seriata]|uniref:Cyclin-dependent kinase 4 n=1 Tax=Diplodia seriata TaxID=420778 RepID=A0A1S8BDZ6_9PEZI|nr:Cyclin-dependent kinase 4 [Diplodia seriata]